MGKIWNVLNQPFTIFVCSAIFVGAGGILYDDLKQCRSEAAQEIIDYRDLGREITRRWEVLSSAVFRADTLKELQDNEIVRNWRDHYFQQRFKGRRIEELEFEWGLLAIRFGAGRQTFGWKKLGLLIEEFSKGKLPWQFDFDRFNVSVLKEKDLPELKRITEKLEKFLYDENFSSFGTYVAPVCSIAFSIKRTIFGDPGYVAELRKNETAIERIRKIREAKGGKNSEGK